MNASRGSRLTASVHESRVALAARAARSMDSFLGLVVFMVKTKFCIVASLSSAPCASTDRKGTRTGHVLQSDSGSQ